MFQVPGRFEQRLDFGLAQNHGELLLVPRQGNPVDLDLPVERVLVEETERADRLNIGRELYSSFVEQEQLPRPDLFRTELFGRLLEVFGELGDRADVASHGRGSVVADAEILQHPLSE